MLFGARRSGFPFPVREGDMIISFHGRPVNSMHELFKELTKKDILTAVDISVIRHTELLNFSIFPVVKG